jgi:hypothetical protein
VSERHRPDDAPRELREYLREVEREPREACAWLAKERGSDARMHPDVLARVRREAAQSRDEEPD